MSLPVKIASLWKSRSALLRARELSLSIHDTIQRQAAASSSKVVFIDAHTGAPHLEFFRREFPPILETMPPGFKALEIGAGMCWVAAMLAAKDPQSQVLATEILWDQDKPWGEGNAHTFYRLAKEDPTLNDVVNFHFDETQELRSVSFDPRLSLVRASAHNLPADDESLDLVYTQNCLEHIPNIYQSTREAERVLKPGGMLFHSTEPLFYSPFGHHMESLCPLPWGHLLWEEEEFAELVVSLTGKEKEWRPGEPFCEEHILGEILPSLNAMPPWMVRRAMLHGRWRLDAWLEIVDPRSEEWLEEMRPWEVFHGIDSDALLMKGLRYRATKRSDALAIPKPTLLLPASWRNALKGMLNRDHSLVP